jgi:hypothetical protein
MTGARRLGTRTEGDAMPPLTSIALDVPALDLVMQWGRCGVIADFLADYLACSFSRREVARSVLSTVANELVENAGRFAGDKRGGVRLFARHRGEHVEIGSENRAAPRHVAVLEGLFAALDRESPEVLFARRIESGERGGLGLLILAKDYGSLGATLGDPDADGLASVTIVAALDVAQVEQG